MKLEYANGIDRHDIHNEKGCLIIMYSRRIG